MSEIYLPVILGGGGQVEADEVMSPGDDGDFLGTRDRLAGVALPRGLGVGVPWQTRLPVAAWLSALGDPWWYDWHWVGSGPGYQRMIYSGPGAYLMSVLPQLAAREPERLWLLFNEPERADQANLSPGEAAGIAWSVLETGVQAALPGVIVTEDGLAWLDAYLAAGGPAPDAWHVHVYYASTAAALSQKLDIWRDWMQERNLVRPTIVSEFNGQWSAAAVEVEVLRAMVEEIERRTWLQAAAYFSLQYKDGVTCLVEDGELSEIGRVFAAACAKGG